MNSPEDRGPVRRIPRVAPRELAFNDKQVSWGPVDKTAIPTRSLQGWSHRARKWQQLTLSVYPVLSPVQKHLLPRNPYKPGILMLSYSGSRGMGRTVKRTWLFSGHGVVLGLKCIRFHSKALSEPLLCGLIDTVSDWGEEGAMHKGVEAVTWFNVGLRMPPLQ
jgi:hypothetical protein